MAENKVKFGLEQVYVAFEEADTQLEVAQVETATVVGTITTAGDAAVTITAEGMKNSPKEINVAVAEFDDAADIAGKIITGLEADSDVSEVFNISGTDADVVLTKKKAAANDDTLNIAVADGTCVGITAALTSADTKAGVSRWGIPKHIPGAVGFSPSAQGEETKFYADNKLYYLASTNQGYTADLEMALLPDAVLAEMLGWTIDANGMLIEESEAVPKKFALMGQIQGDAKNRRFVYYDCLANRPSKQEVKTREKSIDPATDVLPLVISPIEINGKNVVRGVLELSATNEAAYNAFFMGVTKPVFG